MITQKKCKSQGKAFGFESCGKLTNVKNLKFGLCMNCYPTWLLTTEPGKIYMAKAMTIGKSDVTKKVKENNRNEKKKLIEKTKTLSKYESEAKKSFQKWIRLRDGDLPCISCNENGKDIWDGGHFFKAEIFSGLIFDIRNCHKQCRKCNRFLGGNEIQYRMGLVNRFGKELVEQLEIESDSKRVYKYSKQELIDIKNKYDFKIKNKDYEK